MNAYPQEQLSPLIDAVASVEMLLKENDRLRKLVATLESALTLRDSTAATLTARHAITEAERLRYADLLLKVHQILSTGG